MADVMESPVLLTLLSVTAVSLLSLIGVVLLGLQDAAMRRLILSFVSFSSGVLLGDVFLHIIPELSSSPLFHPQYTLTMLGGILLSFTVEKGIHWQHCHVLPCEEHHHPVGILSLIADGLHNFIDGLLIAGSFLVSVPLGIATTTAVIFHEIPQEIGHYALLIFSGYTKTRALAYNLLSALTAIIGAVLILVIGSSVPALGNYLLALTAGNFLYIAGTDLIPELHRGMTRFLPALLQLALLTAGIAVMYGLTMMGS
ncbi:TPA: ZIP family metal transporter [Candidatus Peribacteria bacterium]|nr:ZIP family metal transporter [Candidatus Peribacteria bacterium]HAS34183.1 ZIP family metal transporter [Candidatus Peribacteria bacterium]